MEIIILTLENGSEFTFSNVAYAPEYDSHLISLGQLQETDILYHNHLGCIVLEQGKNVIRTAKKKNLFVFNT